MPEVQSIEFELSNCYHGKKEEETIKLKKRALIVLCLLMIPSVIFGADGKIEKLDVKAALLVDLKTGRVLYEQSADKIIQPASLTKIMSLYLISEDIEKRKANYSDLISISENALHTDGSKMIHSAAKKYEAFDLIKGMAIYSANDASVAMAEYCEGSVEQFVLRMNAKSKDLGMKHTLFVNPHGLYDKRQKTTARDISRLSQAYLSRFPNMLKIHSLESFAVDGDLFKNRNDLLRGYPGTDGLKTGYIVVSGFHVVATVRREDKRLMAVVLGAKTPKIRTSQTIKLLDYGFQKLAGSGERNSKKTAKIRKRHLK